LKDESIDPPDQEGKQPAQLPKALPVTASVEIVMAKKTMIFLVKPSSLLEPQDEQNKILLKPADFRLFF
jgi:hypothetical protein